MVSSCLSWLVRNPENYPFQFSINALKREFNAWPFTLYSALHAMLIFADYVGFKTQIPFGDFERGKYWIDSYWTLWYTCILLNCLNLEELHTEVLCTKKLYQQHLLHPFHGAVSKPCGKWQYLSSANFIFVLIIMVIYRFSQG